MNYCKKCKRSDVCDYVWKNTENPVCVSYTPIQTNGDVVRGMTDEELAEQIADEWCDLVCGHENDYCAGNCKEKILAWLKQEAKE